MLLGAPNTVPPREPAVPQGPMTAPAQAPLPAPRPLSSSSPARSAPVTTGVQLGMVVILPPLPRPNLLDPPVPMARPPSMFAAM